MTMIRKLDGGKYEITLQGSANTERFAMSVESKDGIDVVVWGDDFASYLRRNLSPAQPIFEAVLSFHRGAAVALP